MFFLFLALLFSGPVVGQEPCADLLRGRIEAARQPLLQQPAFVRHAVEVAALYGGRSAPLWLSGDGPSPQALGLADQLAAAENKGLDPGDYDGGYWRERLEAAAGLNACERWDLDLAFSVALMRYVSDLRVGRVDPRDLGFHLDVEPKRPDLAGFLRQLVQSADPVALVDSLEPPFRRYRALLGALARYRSLARDPRLLEPLPVPARSVRPGDAYSQLERLAYRLERLGDLAPGSQRVPDDGRYGEELAAAVRRFQARHGLAVDGILGRRTLSALNQGMTRRLEQIRLTLERWRWLPDDLGHRPLVINVPEFRLYAFEDDGNGGYRLALDMPVIVGRAYRRHRTPLFHGVMQYIVFAPYWNVPYGIQRRELYPEILEDPAYLAEHGLEIVPDFRPESRPLPASPENIALLASGELKLRQPPGPDNPLGVAKFIFPNDHSVYLHGTPAQGLFFKYRRDFSHGCIRVEDPSRLAAHVLARQPGWDRAQVDAQVATGERRVVNLETGLAVFVLYGTAVADPDGTVRFFQDIYRHDRRLAEALAARGEVSERDAGPGVAELSGGVR